MRMILTHNLTDNAGTLDIRPVPGIVHFMHTEQNTTMDWLQTIPNIR